MAERVIEIEGLRKSYDDVEAVRGIDLHVERGEVFALLGPNGAGKTTTTEILEGFRPRDGGEVSVLGYDPARGERELKRRVGIVLQSTGVDPFLTVRETIDQYGAFYAHPRPTEEVIELVGLAREARLAGEQALGWPAAPAGRCDRPRRRPGAAVPGRTDHRVRPERSAERLASPAEPHVARENDLADDALHGRGAVPRATGRGDQGRRDRRRGPSRLAGWQGGDEDEDPVPVARRHLGHARPRRDSRFPTAPSSSPPTTPRARPTSSRDGRSNVASRSRASRSRGRRSRTSTSS